MSGVQNRGALKAIAPVPSSTDFLDIVLSKTLVFRVTRIILIMTDNAKHLRSPFDGQINDKLISNRIHKGFKISRIRSFYMRKVKFAQDAFHERLEQILTEFPVLDNLHPFLSALLNVLYDKNHYKLALGQLNTAKHLVDNVGKDYARLLKFGDSLYRCKQLKKAALGRMATVMKRQKDPLAYLEQVRQHMSRLPTIDPTTRTLLVCGYPNVGKSSFMNKVTRADVDVQPYAFTTKSLFVGHMDYKYLRWQVIDTPGILDHPLDEMNTIEMQSITALAHLRSCILYFMDLSEQCGYTLEAQCKLFESIKPLFANKPTFIIINKIDVMRLEELDPASRAMIDALLTDNIQLLQLSCVSEENVMDVRNVACDALLAHRVDVKEKTKRADNVSSRLRVAQPTARDDTVRAPFIPEGVSQRRKFDANDPERRQLERDLEAEGGGAGVFSSDLKKSYLLENPDWNHDIMPEVLEGKNIADFVDADILDRLNELEAEEERLEEEGFYDSDSDNIENSDDEAIKTTATAIRKRRENMRVSNHAKKDSMRNTMPMPRPSQHRTTTQLTSALKRAGYDTKTLEQRTALLGEARQMVKVGKRKRDANGDVEMGAEDAWVDENSMDVDGAASSSPKKVKSNTGAALKSRVPTKNRTMAGLRDDEQAEKHRQLTRLAQRGPNRLAKAGEADRVIRTKMPKHLFSGKRKSGKTGWR